MVRVDSRDPQTSNISIWRYHYLGEVAFLKIWNQFDYCLIQCIRGFCSSPLPIFKLSLQVPWIDSNTKLLFCSFLQHPWYNAIYTVCGLHPMCVTLLPCLRVYSSCTWQSQSWCETGDLAKVCTGNLFEGSTRLQGSFNRFDDVYTFIYWYNYYGYYDIQLKRKVS